MKKLSTYGAVASIFLLTAGPAALAQNYNPNYGQDPNYGQSQNYGHRIPDQNWNRSGSDWNGAACGAACRIKAGAKAAGIRAVAAGPGLGQLREQSGSQQGSSQQSGMRNRDLNGPSAQDAWQELSKYGYKNIQRHGTLRGLAGARHEERRARLRLHR